MDYGDGYRRSLFLTKYSCSALPLERGIRGRNGPGLVRAAEDRPGIIFLLALTGRHAK